MFLLMPLFCLSSGYVEAQYDEGLLSTPASVETAASEFDLLPDNVLAQRKVKVGDEEYVITEFADGTVKTRCKKGKKGKKGRK